MSTTIPSRATYETARMARLSPAPQLYDVMIDDIRRVVSKKLHSGAELPDYTSFRIEHFRNSFDFAKKDMFVEDMKRTTKWQMLVDDLKQGGFVLSHVRFVEGYDSENGGDGKYCAFALDNIP